MTTPVQILTSDPTLKSPEVIADTKAAIEEAERLRNVLIDQTRDPIVQYLEEFEKTSRLRSPFYLEIEQKACKAAGVPVVQIPDSVIYQLTHLAGQEDSSVFIDAIHHSSPNQDALDTLTAQLESCNQQIAEEKHKLKQYLAEIIALHEAEAHRDEPVPPAIVLPVNVLRSFNTAELNQLEQANASLAKKPALPEEDYKRKLETLQTSISTVSNKVNAINNDRLDIQANLIVEQGKAMTYNQRNPMKILSGEEVLSNYMFNELYQ